MTNIKKLIMFRFFTHTIILLGQTLTLIALWLMWMNDQHMSIILIIIDIVNVLEG